MTAIHCSKVLAERLRKKNIYGIQIEKDEVKLSLLTGDILYTENHKDSTKNKPVTIEKQDSVKLQDTKSICKILLCFYTLKVNYQKEKLRQQGPTV